MKKMAAQVQFCLFLYAFLSCSLCVNKGHTYLPSYLKPLNYSPQKKRRLKNDFVLTHKILYNLVGLESTQSFKLCKNPGLRRSSVRLLHQTDRTHRRRNSFTGTVCHSQSHRHQSNVHSKNYYTHTFTHKFCSLFYFRSNMIFWGNLSLPIS